MRSSGRRERAGAPKTINEKDRPAVRLGQSVLIRAFPPVATAAQRQAASEFNTRRRSCALEAQKDTVERRYVPRLIIRAVSVLRFYVPFLLPPPPPLCVPQNFFWSCLAHHASNNRATMTSNSLLCLYSAAYFRPPPRFPQSNPFPPPTSHCERGSEAPHQWEKSSDERGIKASSSPLTSKSGPSQLDPRRAMVDG